MSVHHPKRKALYRSTSGQIGPPTPHWKDYLVRDFNAQYFGMEKSTFSRNHNVLSPQNSISRVTYEQGYLPYEEENRRKSEMLRRVKQIKEKVGPLLQNRGREQQREETGGNTRLEKRIMKLETAVDALQKKLDLRIQEKFIQLREFVIQKLISIQQKVSK